MVFPTFFKHADSDDMAFSISINYKCVINSDDMAFSISINYKCVINSGNVAIPLHYTLTPLAVSMCGIYHVL